MRRSFYEKVKKYGTVYTRKYIYILEDFGNVACLPLKYLCTAEAIDGWKIIKIPHWWK